MVDFSREQVDAARALLKYPNMSKTEREAALLIDDQFAEITRLNAVIAERDAEVEKFRIAHVALTNLKNYAEAELQKAKERVACLDDLLKPVLDFGRTRNYPLGSSIISGLLDEFKQIESKLAQGVIVPREVYDRIKRVYDTIRPVFSKPFDEEFLKVGEQE